MGSSVSTVGMIIEQQQTENTWVEEGSSGLIWGIILAFSCRKNQEKFQSEWLLSRFEARIF